MDGRAEPGKDVVPTDLTLTMPVWAVPLCVSFLSFFFIILILFSGILLGTQPNHNATNHKC